jgi:Zn-dependent peptidase ImmA (M78 family)/transcriptional regulator with XRE-family HTH domain
MMTTADRALRLMSKSQNCDERRLFNPTRLALARKRKGWSKLAFAEKIGVDRKSVEAYEAGKTIPSDETIAEIVRVSGFPCEFFMGDDIEEPTVESGSFRALTKMTAAQRDMALSQAALGLHFNAWITRKFSLPSVQVPNLGREPNPETAAEVVRKTWQLGALSIRNMVHLLEAKGVRVFSLAVDAREVDAFSMWNGNVAFVFLNTNKTSEHSRFDAAHELGHLVLHQHGTPQGLEAERQANMFASAFLMPRSTAFARAPRFPTYENLVRLKRQWGVSVAALAYRLHELGLMTDWHYRSIAIEISKRGRTFEPRELPRESSVVMKEILAELYRSGYSRAQIAKELAIPTSELEQLLFGLTMTAIPGGGKGGSTGSLGLTRIK